MPPGAFAEAIGPAPLMSGPRRSWLSARRSLRCRPPVCTRTSSSPDGRRRHRWHPAGAHTPPAPTVWTVADAAGTARTPAQAASRARQGRRAVMVDIPVGASAGYAVRQRIRQSRVGVGYHSCPRPRRVAPRSPPMPHADLKLHEPVGDEVKTTTCYMCACRCGIQVHLKDGRCPLHPGQSRSPREPRRDLRQGSAGIQQHYRPRACANPAARRRTR